MAAILVVDDAASIRAFLRQALEPGGHTITEAADGKAALLHLQRQPFDVIITDLYMPEFDGMQLISYCRKTGLLARVIAISSEDSPVDLLRTARMLGAAATLRKPFPAPAIIAAVEAVLRGSTARLPSTPLRRTP